MREQHISTQHYWESQQPIFDKIYSLPMEQYIKTLPDLSNAFILKDRALRCIDERTAGGIHLAGSGILMKEEQLRKTLREAGVTSAWTHAECGAAKLYAQQNGLDIAKADDYARAFGENLEKNFGIKYNGHLDVAPNGLHIARVAYYDATGNFDYQNISGLPPGFIISRKFVEAEYALIELRVAISIACGDHGFGQLISPASPFVIIPIADNKNSALSLDILIKELESVTANNPLVVISGFTAPHIILPETSINISQYQ